MLASQIERRRTSSENSGSNLGAGSEKTDTATLTDNTGSVAIVVSMVDHEVGTVALVSIGLPCATIT